MAMAAVFIAQRQQENFEQGLEQSIKEVLPDEEEDEGEDGKNAQEFYDTGTRTSTPARTEAWKHPRARLVWPGPARPGPARLGMARPPNARTANTYTHAHAHIACPGKTRTMQSTHPLVHTDAQAHARAHACTCTQTLLCMQLSASRFPMRFYVHACFRCN